MLIAIDPGPVESAYVGWDGEKILFHFKRPNGDLLNGLHNERKKHGDSVFGPHLSGKPLYIEMIASYGMPVGREVFETCVWIGRFLEAYGGAQLVYRKDVKLHLCQSVRAKDSNVVQALHDRFGGKGKKAAPGLTYGLKADEWQAFALAVYAHDKAESGGVDTQGDKG